MRTNVPLGSIGERFSAIEAARVLLLTELVVITFSPALVNLVEFLLILVVASSSHLRKVIISSFKTYLPAKILLAFFFWIVLSAFWGDASVGARLHEVVSWRKIFLFLLVMALVSDDFKIVMLRVISTFGVACAVAVWAIGLQNDVYEGPAVIMRSDVVQGIYLGLSSLAILCLLGTNFSKLSGTSRTLMSVAALFLLVTVFSSTGRSGYLFTMVGLCCFSWIAMPRYRLLLTTSIGLTLVTLILLVPTTADRFEGALSEIVSVTDGRQDPEFSSMGIRIVMWDNTLDMIGDKPLLGSGAGSFEDDYGKVAQAKATGWRAKRSSDPHQQYLHIAAEFGLVGLGIFLLFLASLLLGFKLTFISIFGMSILLGISATSFFNGHFSSLVEGRIFWILTPLFLLSLSEMKHVETPPFGKIRG